LKGPMARYADRGYHSNPEPTLREDAYFFSRTSYE
jgi:hypothetical protein